MRPVAPRALALLARQLESPQGRLIPGLLETADRPAFRALAEAGALTRTGAQPPAILCPSCELQDVAPEIHGTSLRGLCPACGYVRIDERLLQTWQPDHDWLLAALRRALGMAARQDSRVLREDLIWKVGDAVEGRNRRRVLLARRLGDPQVRQALDSILQDQVERNNGVVIGTTSRSRAQWAALSLPYVHLAELFRWRSGSLELDKGLWAWCLKPPHLRRHDCNSVFSEDFRSAIIDGEEYTFGAKEALAWEYLYNAKGSKRHKSLIMAAVGSDQSGPRELFRHDLRQMAAFQQLVAFDDNGFYWLKAP